jgi:hypothetical protein
MVEVMHDFVLTSTKAIMQAINYFFMNVNEVTTLDNWQWISVHVYVMKDWCRFPILLTLERVEMNVTAINITLILLKCMAKYRGVSIEKLA